MPYRKRIYYKKNKKNTWITANRACVSKPISSWEAISAQAGTSIATRQTAVTVHKATNSNFYCKLKNFDITVAVPQLGTSQIIRWALVYVPEGYLPNKIVWPTNDNYEYLVTNEQFCIASGLLTWDHGLDHKFSTLSRKLVSGDSIQLIFAMDQDQWSASYNYGVQAEVNYGITNM